MDGRTVQQSVSVGSRALLGPPPETDAGGCRSVEAHVLVMALGKCWFRRPREPSNESTTRQHRLDMPQVGWAGGGGGERGVPVNKGGGEE